MMTSRLESLPRPSAVVSVPATDASDELSAALERLGAALGAMSRGDPVPYAAMWPRDPDVTLFGAWGPIERGHEAVTGTFKWVGSRFSDGTLAPEHHVIASSGDLAYTVGFERGTSASTTATSSRW